MPHFAIHEILYRDELGETARIEPAESLGGVGRTPRQRAVPRIAAPRQPRTRRGRGRRRGFRYPYP